MPEDERHSLTELADLAAVTPRTVRYYLAQGLLPAVGPSGPGSKYDATHLARLRLIRRLQAEHLPLAEIRRRLEGLDDLEIRDLAGQADPTPPPDSALDYLRTLLDGPPERRSQGAAAASSLPPVAPPPAEMRRAPSLARRLSSEPPAVAAPSAEPHDDPPPASTPLERSQWERITLAADVELHIRRPLTRAQQKGVDRLVTIARELLEEDRP